jgi:hypothetical protein
MTLADFVAKVAAGEIRIPVGGRDKDGRLVTGFGNPAALTNEQVAAEAFSRDVDEAASVSFEEMVVLVGKVRSDGGTV